MGGAAYLRRGGASAVLNCGYGVGHSVLDIVAAVERAAGHHIATRDSPRRAGDPPALVAGAALIRRHLGWAPERNDLDGIVRAALNWERRLARRRAAR